MPGPARSHLKVHLRVSLPASIGPIPSLERNGNAHDWRNHRWPPSTTGKGRPTSTASGLVLANREAGPTEAPARTCCCTAPASSFMFRYLSALSFRPLPLDRHRPPGLPSSKASSTPPRHYPGLLGRTVDTRSPLAPTRRGPAEQTVDTRCTVGPRPAARRHQKDVRQQHDSGTPAADMRPDAGEAFGGQNTGHTAAPAHLRPAITEPGNRARSLDEHAAINLEGGRIIPATESPISVARPGRVPAVPNDVAQPKVHQRAAPQPGTSFKHRPRPG